MLYCIHTSPSLTTYRFLSPYSARLICRCLNDCHTLQYLCLLLGLAAPMPSISGHIELFPLPLDLTVFAIFCFFPVSHILAVTLIVFCQVFYYMGPRTYTCVEACKAEWQKPAPFNQHQRLCEHWLAHKDNMRELRLQHAAGLPPKK